MDLSSSTALVTGANRGFGRHLAEQLVARGATVYAGARRPESIDLPGVRQLRIDVTDTTSIEAAAAVATDLDLLINNAGTGTISSVLSGAVDDLRLELETHALGTLAVTRAFAPAIERNGGGTVLNVLSVLSWFASPTFGAYGAAKAAEWSITNSLRIELAPRGVRVSALHVGFMDTDLVREVQAPKLDPAAVAKLTLDGIAADAPEILADDLSRRVQQGLAGGVAALYPDTVVAFANGGREGRHPSRGS